jgi:hypothetical protein
MQYIHILNAIIIFMEVIFIVSLEINILLTSVTAYTVNLDPEHA